MAEKQIALLTKQNDSIYNSLLNKGIEFQRLSIEGVDDTNKLTILQDENKQLKELSKANKPKPEPKKEKVKVEEEDVPKEEVKKFSYITNMDDLKRSFFNDEMSPFLIGVRDTPFKFYNATYKFSSDNDGKEPYIATNLLSGFVRNFDKIKGHFMIVFRCWEQDKKYKYDSHWLLNSEDDLKDIIGSLYDDFDFVETDVETFLRDIQKMEDGKIRDNFTMICESYVH